MMGSKSALTIWAIMRFLKSIHPIDDRHNLSWVALTLAEIGVEQGDISVVSEGDRSYRSNSRSPSSMGVASPSRIDSHHNHHAT